MDCGWPRTDEADEREPMDEELLGTDGAIEDVDLDVEPEEVEA